MMATSEQEPTLRITFYTKVDCELCHAAKATLLAVQAELGFTLDEIDITTDPTLYQAFQEEIPVGYLGGRKLFKFRVDAAQLRRQLQGRGRWHFGRWWMPARSSS